MLLSDTCSFEPCLIDSVVSRWDTSHTCPSSAVHMEVENVIQSKAHLNKFPTFKKKNLN